MRNDIFRNKIIDYSKAIRCSEFELLILEVEKKPNKQYYHSEVVEFYEIKISKINPKSRIVKFVNQFSIDKEDYDSYIKSGIIPVYFNFFQNDNKLVTINNIRNDKTKGSILNLYNFANIELIEKVFIPKKINFSNLLIEFNSDYIRLKTKFDEEIYTFQTNFKARDKNLNNDLDFIEYINEIEEKQRSLKIATKHYFFQNFFEPYYIFTPEEWDMIVTKNKIFGYKVLDEKGNSFKKNLYHQAFVSITSTQWNDKITEEFFIQKQQVLIALKKKIEELSTKEYHIYQQKQLEESKNIQQAKFENPFPDHPEAWDNID